MVDRNCHMGNFIINVIKAKSRQARSRSKSDILRYTRATYICTGVVISYVLLWLPHMLHDILEFVDDSIKFNSSGGQYVMTTYVLAFSNSIIDPIIYISLNRSIKKEIKRFVICCLNNPHTKDMINRQV